MNVVFSMQKQGNAYVLLRLKISHDDRWSTFAKSKAFQFPAYIAQEKRTATKADLSAEIALLLKHNSEEISRGLCSGKLHAAMFDFSRKQLEALQLVALVDHYMLGGNEKDRPTWVFDYSSTAKIVIDELLIACPR